MPLPIEDSHSISIDPTFSFEPVSSTSHSMVTRVKHGIYKPNPRYALLLTYGDIPTEPRPVKAALQHDGWRKAMFDELDASHQNLTWTLVSRDSHMNVIGLKWVFKAKLKADDTLHRLKAPLIAKRYH